MKYVLVSGGVISGVGKGIIGMCDPSTASSTSETLGAVHSSAKMAK